MKIHMLIKNKMKDEKNCRFALHADILCYSGVERFEIICKSIICVLVYINHNFPFDQSVNCSQTLFSLTGIIVSKAGPGSQRVYLSSSLSQIRHVGLNAV